MNEKQNDMFKKKNVFCFTGCSSLLPGLVCSQSLVDREPDKIYETRTLRNFTDKVINHGVTSDKGIRQNFHC
jgi:hypothetical protein